MGERTSYAPGTFSWADLATTDVGGAKSFYGAMFGWESQDNPTDGGPPYTMFKLNGRDVCAAYEQMDDERQQGIPPHWNSYVTVESADGTAARARELGGNVLVDPFDVMDVGRMAVLRDPSGGVLSAWEPRAHVGAGVVNDVGAMTWNELATRDVDGAKDFFLGLFGWEYEDDEGSGYATIRNDGRLNGGIRPLRDDQAEVPPHWLVYFTVEAVDDAGRRAEEAGGRVMVPAMEVPVGRISVLTDPQGAAFAVFEGETEP